MSATYNAKAWALRKAGELLSNVEFADKDSGDALRELIDELDRRAERAEKIAARQR